MRTLRATTTAITLTLTALLALAACSNDDPADPVATPTATQASHSVARTAPPLPDTATKPTEAGARAFITHYWDLINYAQATGDVDALDAAAAPTCDTCAGFVKEVEQLYAAGGFIVGGVNTATIQRVRLLDLPGDQVIGYEIPLKVTNEEQSVTAGSGEVTEYPAGVNHLIAYVLWTVDGEWRMDVMELEQ